MSNNLNPQISKFLSPEIPNDNKQNGPKGQSFDTIQYKWYRLLSLQIHLSMIPEDH